MKKYLIFDLDGTLIDSAIGGTKHELKCIKKINPDLEEKARYILKTTPGLPVYKQLKIIFEDENVDNDQIRKWGDEIYNKLRKKEDRFDFFDGTEKLIKKLSKNYDLFLTTGNSTRFAKEMLDKGGIKKHFELIFGSNKIPKGHLHLETFKEYSGDDDFYKNSVYIGDGAMDRIFAGEMGIDFVHIGTGGKDKFEIDNIIKLSNILKGF